MLRCAFRALHERTLKLERVRLGGTGVWTSLRPFAIRALALRVAVCLMLVAASCAAPNAPPPTEARLHDRFRADIAVLASLANEIPHYGGADAAAASVPPTVWIQGSLTSFFELAEAQRKRTGDSAVAAIAATKSPTAALAIARTFADAWDALAASLQREASKALAVAFAGEPLRAIATSELELRLAPNRIAAFAVCAALATKLDGTAAEDHACAREVERLRGRVSAAERDAKAVFEPRRIERPWIETSRHAPCVFAGSLRTVTGEPVFARSDAKEPLALLAPSEGVEIERLDLGRCEEGRGRVEIAYPFKATFYVDRTVAWVELARRVSSSDGAIELGARASVRIRGVSGTTAYVAPLDITDVVRFPHASENLRLSASCDDLRLAGSSTFGAARLAVEASRDERDEQDASRSRKRVRKSGAWLSQRPSAGAAIAHLSDLNVEVLEVMGARAHVRAVVATLRVNGWIDTGVLEANVPGLFGIVNVEPRAISGGALEVRALGGVSLFAEPDARASAIARVVTGATVFVGRTLPSNFVEVRLRELRAPRGDAPFYARAAELFGSLPVP
jgi:hypothetical protein